MLFIFAGFAFLVIVVVTAMQHPLFRRRSTIGRVPPGAFASMLAAEPPQDPALVSELGISDVSNAAGRGDQSVAGPSPDGVAPTRAVAGKTLAGDASVPAALSGLVDLHRWMSPDQQVLDAMQQMTHDHVSNTLDLWHEVHSNGYDLMAGSSLINWRGHVGEQEVAAQLNSWAGNRAHLWPDSNHPGSDLTFDGHAYNVKITADYNNVASEHFAHNPDIPLIVNADAAHLPVDALHVDLSQPFDPAMLHDHSVIVAEGLSASGIEATLHDAFGDAMGAHLEFGDLLHAAQDAGIPVIGSAIRVVRSGIREGKLHSVHGDTGRTVKNIATDVGVVGGGVAIGQMIGHGVGAVVDVATLGTTVGLGTVLGGMAGAAVGGFFGSKKAWDIRLQPLHEAQSAAKTAVEHYSIAVDEASASAERLWLAELDHTRRECDNAIERLRIEVNAIMADARSGLAVRELIGQDAALKHLMTAAERVVAAARTERSLLVRRRARAWHAEAAKAIRVEAMFDVILASPGGLEEVRSILAAVRRRREVVMAACACGVRSAARRAAVRRAELSQRLANVREAIQDECRQKLADPLAEIERASDLVKHELAASGMHG